MGLIKQGILGGFRKKTGTVVGAYWRRLDVIRSLPRSSGKAPTEAQVNQQLRFALATSFLSNMSSLIDVGFKAASQISTPMNVAVSYHLKEAIVGVAPDFTMDLTKVKFSKGSLEQPDEAEAAAAGNNIVGLTWDAGNGDSTKLDATDRLSVLVYNPIKNRFLKLVDVASRADTSCELSLPANFVGDEVHVYISFNSTKKKYLCSDSMYLGMVTVS